MRYVSMEKVEPGMVLGKSVYDEADRVLLGAANILTRDFIDKLEIRGFQGLYIDDEISKGINIEETISVELRNRGAKSVKECNIDVSLDVAKSIVDQMISSKSISLDLIDLRTFDDYTYRHSVNVAVLCTVIGIGMNLNQKELVELCAAAIFHDLGKLQVPDEILNKPARLTTEEYEIIKEHPRLSYDIIKGRWDISARTKVGVLHHHENEDGSGYPDGLVSNQIYLYAKIIHVADVYDALTSKRPYKKPYALSDAAEYLMTGYGVLFDEKVVEAFLKYVPIYPKGMEVVLSDGREGIIAENTTNTLRPKVRLLDGTEIDLNDGVSYRNITLYANDEDHETDFSNDKNYNSKKD
ncbi:MAG: HD-GYP domain-containing protein [Acetivibrio sp.]